MSQKFTYRNPKILKHARGQACQNCGTQDETIVAAHSNQAKHGKGAGQKAHDIFVAYLCHQCHAWLDQGTGFDPTGIWGQEWQERRDMFNSAMFKTQILLLRDGVIG